MLLFRGLRVRGALTGITFPVKLGDLTRSRGGPALLTEMLRHDGHLPAGVRVRAIHDEAADIRDGVKGDKGLITVEYDYTHSPCVLALPTRFFVKFNVGKLSAMRLLVETTECAKCEVLFYNLLAPKLPPTVRTPRVFFADYSSISGDFVLLSEAIAFGEGDVLALKHRVRDPARLDEQKAFCVVGATLNAACWWDEDEEAAAAAAAAAPPGCTLIDRATLATLPRFDLTHGRFWTVAQAIAHLGGLHHTARRTLNGRSGLNDAFMTWEPPADLIGREAELISEMPALMASLCAP